MKPERGLAIRGLVIPSKECGLHPGSLGRSLKEQRSGLIRFTLSPYDWSVVKSRGRKASVRLVLVNQERGGSELNIQTDNSH